jgi:hypothetical protein
MNGSDKLAEAEEDAVYRIRMVGQLLEMMLTEGVVEDSVIGRRACEVLSSLGLVTGSEPVAIGNATYQRLAFTPAGRLARGEDPTLDDDVALARKVDELQTKLNFDEVAAGRRTLSRSTDDDWSRVEVISLILARARLRGAP